MKKIKYILCLLVVCTSCDDFLEVEPDLQTSINEQLSTKNGVLDAYNGIYRDVEGILSSRFSVYADVQGGNITFTPSTISKVVNVPSQIENSYPFNDRFQESDYADYYEELYSIIAQVNLLLERFNEFTFFTTQERNRLEAELLTLRAFSHYQLALHYAQHYGFTADASHLGVVYNTTVLTAGVDFPSRSSMAETYTNIQADLNAALALFNTTQLLSGVPYSYFNEINTKALYARIALQMNDWEQARAMANDVIANPGITLTSQGNYISEWENDLLPINEVILEFTAPVSSDGTVSSSVSANYQYTNTTNYADYVASEDLRNLFEATDIRLNLFQEQSLTTSVNGAETQVAYYFTKKFQGNTGTLFMRLSEMYLIQAEANARLGDTAAAFVALNAIRTRAGIATVNDTNTLLEDIFTERRRELAFEGFLLFDIARYQKDVERNLGCIASANCNLSYPSNFFILPIPASSAELNQNIQQNEGY
ncbi:MAG: RagB/SusD family nutrient uptake outer membrane protein [Bacteroidota bacterium]